MTSWIKRYDNIYKLFTEKAFNGNEAMITEDEYNKIINTVATGNNDDLFETYPDEFKSIPIRSWAEKVKELSTTASIQDASSVREHL